MKRIDKLLNNTDDNVCTESLAEACRKLAGIPCEKLSNIREPHIMLTGRLQKNSSSTV